ncbi:MAG: DUF89 family protein [Planctomycetes bacterium]|nr:DUF89 family protein [Planctomycetota bacterium]
MKTFIECVPCLVRQAYEASTFATEDESLREEIIREALVKISNIRMDQSPPHMAAEIHRMVREKTRHRDPYASVKQKFNDAALELYPLMRQRVKGNSSPFDTAVRLAIAGNVIDFGAPGNPQESGLPELIGHALSCPVAGHSIKEFEEALELSETILFLGDNAGEIVFDRLLIEELKDKRVTYAVKGTPVLNDVTMDDARAAGICDIVPVIDNGSDAPGTILDWCSPAFVEKFISVDLVIAKGQGNYESLSGTSHPGVYFLLKAKCPIIARSIGCQVGDFVIESTNKSKVPLLESV